MQRLFSVVVVICVVSVLATAQRETFSRIIQIRGNPDHDNDDIFSVFDKIRGNRHDNSDFDNQNEPEPIENRPSQATGNFRSVALALHNSYRAKHHSPSLVLDNALNTYAQKWAQTMAQSNSMRHSNGKYGENIYMSSNSKMSDSEAAKQAISIWYNEVSKYNYNGGGFSMATGHFTQIVWKDSKRLGFGVARSSRGVYVCASYDPRGNVMSRFAQNVLRP